MNEIGKGRISWNDFLFIVSKKTEDRDTPADLLSAFEIFDTNVSSSNYFYKGKP